MKISNLPEMTQSAMAFTRKVTEKWPSRLVGSASCLACGDFLSNTFSDFCDDTKVQQFSLNPGAFLGYIRINVVLYLLGLIAIWFQCIGIAVFLASLSVLITVLEFFIYKEFIDFLFPKKTGKNIIGIIEPVGEVHQQIIVSAHHDSAHVFQFLQNDPQTYNRKVIIGTVALFCMFIFTWILLILFWLGLDWSYLFWTLTGVLTILAIPTIRMWFFYTKEGCPGAGDNLICTAIAMEIGKYFSDQKKAEQGLKHTRVMVASWDGEEAGLRGARAYVKAHKEELNHLKTYNFNLECMYDHKEMALLTSDLNSFVPLSLDMVNECQKIGSELGYNIKSNPFPIMGGGTDAAEFAKAGVDATCLAAMSFVSRESDSAYHTLRDTIDAVDSEAVRRSIELGIHYILKMDNKAREIASAVST